jgi:hypothetical protein
VQIAFVSSVALVIFMFVQPLEGACLAQDATSSPAAEDASPPNMSREQWRERVVEAKRRARQLALENRGRIMFNAPSAAEEERIASERVLNEYSLQSGDIVSTNKGLYVFRGRPDRERRDSDFIVLQPR